MSHKKFSKRKALQVGFNMTKKNFGRILGVLLIFFVYNFFSQVLSERAGIISTSVVACGQAFGSPILGKQIHSDLLENGYFNDFGFRQNKIQNLKSPAELDLSPDLEEYREPIYKFLERYTYRLPFSIRIYYIIMFVGWIFSMLMGIGLIRICLALARDQKPRIGELFSNWGLLPSYVIASIIYLFVIICGAILLIIPGVMLAVMLQMYNYLIADEGFGPVESLRMSRSITKGSRWELFVFGWVLFFVNIAGLLCLGIGLFLTIPTSFIGLAYVYDQLRQSGQTSTEDTALT